MCSCKSSIVFLLLAGFVSVMAKPAPFVNGVVIPGIGTVYGYLPGYPQEYPQEYPQGYPGYYPQSPPQAYPGYSPGYSPGYPPTNDSPGETETFDPSTGPRNEVPWGKGATEVDDLNKLIKFNRLIID